MTRSEKLMMLSLEHLALKFNANLTEKEKQEKMETVKQKIAKLKRS